MLISKIINLNLNENRFTCAIFEMLISLSVEENMPLFASRLRFWGISGFCLDNNEEFGDPVPESSDAGSLFPDASAFAHRWYSASYCSISSLEIRYLENSPSRFPFFPSWPASDVDLSDSDWPKNSLIFDRFGILEETVEINLDLSSMTPASTRNSLAEGSRFSRLEE